MQKIVITGASGNVGRSLLPLLPTDDVTVYALARSPEKIPVTGDHVIALPADFDDVASYREILQDADAVFLLSPGDPRMVNWQRDFIDASVAGGVKFLLKQSAMGAVQDAPVAMFRWHAEIEAYLKNTSLRWAILQPNAYTQNLLVHAGSVKEQSALYAPGGDGAVSYIDVDDVARVVASILTTPDRKESKTYTLTGPASVSLHEIAKIFGELRNQPVSYYPITPEQGKTAMLGFGLEEWLVDDLIGIATLGAKNRANTITSTVGELTGKAATSVAKTLTRFQGAFV